MQTITRRISVRRQMYPEWSAASPCLAVVLLLMGILSALGLSGPPTRERPLAFIAATQGELDAIRGQTSVTDELDVQGWKFASGSIAGRPVVLVRCGVGKVNAACASTLLIEQFKPVGVIMVGVSGSVNPELRVGDVVIGAHCVQHDLVVVSDDSLSDKQIRSPIDGAQNPIRFAADEKLVAKLRSMEGAPGSRIVLGLIATGDQFISSAKKKADLRRRAEADVVDMETAAVAQVCWQQAVPFASVRAVSDLADTAAPQDVKANFLRATQSIRGVVPSLFESVNNK